MSSSDDKPPVDWSEGMMWAVLSIGAVLLALIAYAGITRLWPLP